MKIGIEVEGRLRGVPTLFCGAHEIHEARRLILQNRLNVSHVYISDNGNTLDYLTVSSLFAGLLVTLDVTCVGGPRPANISIMLRIDGGDAYDSVNRLTAEDQIKFERDRHVIVLPMTAAITTQPHEFEGDADL